MRVVILASSAYSETACATAVCLAKAGHIPVGALALSSVSFKTFLRKTGQWGFREVGSYAHSKLSSGRKGATIQNACLRPWLEHGSGVFRSLRELSKRYGFPLTIARNQNSPSAIRRLRSWSPDAIIFTGGNILRKPILQVPRLGVINIHLGLLPQVRGMSSPEWSLLAGLPPGITIHYIDEGIDTGPILRRSELREHGPLTSLNDLRRRLIAFGIEQLAQVISALDGNGIAPVSQSQLRAGRLGDSQYFVMHDWLQQLAAQRLNCDRPDPGIMHG